MTCQKAPPSQKKNQRNKTMTDGHFGLGLPAHSRPCLDWNTQDCLHPSWGPAVYFAVDEDSWGAKGTDSSVKNKTLSAGCFPVMAKGLFQKKGLWIWAFDWIPTVPFVHLRSQLPALVPACSSSEGKGFCVLALSAHTKKEAGWKW